MDSADRARKMGSNGKSFPHGCPLSANLKSLVLAGLPVMRVVSSCQSASSQVVVVVVSGRRPTDSELGRNHDSEMEFPFPVRSCVCVCVDDRTANTCSRYRTVCPTSCYRDVTSLALSHQPCLSRQYDIRAALPRNVRHKTSHPMEMKFSPRTERTKPE